MKVLKAFLVVLAVGLSACASLPVKDQCEKLKLAADAACAQDPNGQACTAAAILYSAAGCGTYTKPVVPPKDCTELKCPDNPLEPEKTACADTQGGPACYKPFTPSCPVCPSGSSCTDPAVGCVPDVVIPPPATTCVPACAATEKCVERGSVTKAYECVPIPGTPTEAPLIRDEDLTAVGSAAPSQVWAETNAAIERWRALHPEKWRGDGACLINGTTGIDDAFLGISTELLRVKIIAGQSINGDLKRSDCIFVNRNGTQLYEEAHLFDYARACVATGSNAMKKLYRRGSAPPVEPPPVTDACPAAPCPDRVWTAETPPPGWGQDAIGTPRWKWAAKVHTMGNCDSTPLTNRNEPYCRSIGMSPMGDGTLRAACPMRPDGHSEREAVENWLLEGGPVRHGRNGQDCTPNNTDNPYAFLAGTGNCRICNTPKTVCSDWF